MALFGRSSRRGPGPDGERTSFLVDLHLLSAEEGGRGDPVFRGYRPRLHIGQRLTDGSRIDWDCLWSFDGLLRPGEHARVAVRLHGLPDVVLHQAEVVQFYEGSRLVATGSVVALVPGGAHLFPPVDDVQVHVMRNALDGAPVVSVFHESDGDWQFLTGRPEPGTVQVSRLSSVLALDPALGELVGLPRGMWAHRDGPGLPWEVEDDPEVPVG